MSVVPNTVLHSCSLSIVYFSSSVKMPIISPSSALSAISSPNENSFACAELADSVIGIGQKRPSFSPDFSSISSHTPCQSALFIKPSKGVKPPIPNMIKSPRSRELIVILGNVSAFLRAFSSISPSSNKIFKAGLP